MNLQGVNIGGEVIKLKEGLRDDYPHLEFLLGLLSHDPVPSQSVQGKLDYTTLSAREARCVLYETLDRIGLQPEYILPKTDSVQWQVCEVKEALLVSQTRA